MIRSWLLALTVPFACLVGCAAESSVAEDAIEGDEAELTAAARDLVGAYVDDSGTIKGLVLTSEAVGQQAKFFADIDTGIRCVRAPCPSSARIEGTFTAGTKTITLRSSSPYANVITGKYRYLRQGAKLSLTKDGKSQSLAKETSYCAASDDCYRQAIIVPACMGSFSCNANACAYSCGLPPAPPPSSTKCYSSESCADDEYCTTEDGVCNSSGMLAVCSGTCAKGARDH